MMNKIDPSLDRYIKYALEKKALHMVVLDVRKLSSVADTFVICSGRSNRQVTAIAEHLELELKKEGIKPLSKEGVKEGHWVLMDYGDVIVHVFHEPVRTFYDLEGLWIDAPRITTESMRNQMENDAAGTEDNKKGYHGNDTEAL